MSVVCVAARVCVEGGDEMISAQVVKTESGADAQSIFASTTTKDAMPRREAGSVVA